MKPNNYNDSPIRKFMNNINAEIINLWNIKVEEDKVNEIVDTKITPIETDVLEL